MIYLLHFERPYRHARHYLGFTDDLDARLKDHASGRGSKLMAAVNRAGITWRCVRTWTGDRKLERRLKRHKSTPRLCPICAGARACERATFKTKPVKIVMSQCDQAAICLTCPLAECVGADSPRCPMQAEQKRRWRKNYERAKATASSFFARRTARRAAARQARINL